MNRQIKRQLLIAGAILVGVFLAMYVLSRIG